MNRTKKTAEEAVEEVRSDTAIEAEEAASGQPDEEKNRKQQEEKIKEFLSKLPNPCVYCGPSVRGVARQFDVYHGGIPDELNEFVMKNKAAKGLIVSVERFVQVRARLEIPGTAEAILFNKVRSGL